MLLLPFFYIRCKRGEFQNICYSSNEFNDYEIGICCLSTKYTELRRKNKDWLAQNNVSEWSYMSVCELAL